MALQLLSSQGKRGVDLHLLTMPADIEDTSYLSTYFDVVEFSPIFTAGKNSVAFNGTPLLSPNSEIQVQCIDSNGNSLYLEYPKSKTQFVDVANFVVAIHVYNEIYNGVGKLIVVGTSKKGEIVRWTANISIDKTLQNISKTRFYSTPTMEARSLLYPVISNDIALQQTYLIRFTGSFYANAIIPPKDTIQSYINPKKIDIDYRITYNAPNQSLISPQIYPTTSFNTQMEGQSILLTSNIIQEPFSYKEKYTNVSASFKIKKVINSNTLQVSDAFFYQNGKDQIITNINLGQFTSSYKWISYNTAPDIYKKYVPPGEDPIYVKDSYAEILYRNIGTFSGFIARHKLYRKSSLYPGDFQLLTDEPLGTRELLVDPVTANKSYNLIGSFYNSVHIDKYWFTSSTDFQLSHSVTPQINAMRINTLGSFSKMDGTKYIIVKTDSVDTIPNDHTYWPYDEDQFNELQGLKYNSNFIDLKSGSLYALSMNLSIEKENLDTSAKLQFFFTSSISDIKKEKNYISPFGLKLGEIDVNEDTTTKHFSNKQYFYFTPKEDYFGTLVIVPYHCGAIFSEISLGVYGDHGFSPDSLTTKIPFKVNCQNEVWQLKSELYDINSILVYSDLKTVQTFDATGESLFVFIGNSNIDPSNVSFISGSLTVSKSLFLPNLPGCPPSDKRFIAWEPPTHYPPEAGDGVLCYTNLTAVELLPTNDLGTVTTKDYINIVTTNDNEQSIAIRYSGNGVDIAGRRIYIDSSGVKHTYS